MNPLEEKQSLLLCSLACLRCDECVCAGCNKGNSTGFQHFLLFLFLFLQLPLCCLPFGAQRCDDALEQRILLFKIVDPTMEVIDPRGTWQLPVFLPTVELSMLILEACTLWFYEWKAFSSCAFFPPCTCFVSIPGICVRASIFLFFCDYRAQR